MEFVSDSEYITTLLLIPIFSIGLFLIISFIEILERHGEILFINKKHAYTNKDFIFPLFLAVLVGLGFYMMYFELQDYFNSFPPVVYDCGLGSECHNKELTDKKALKDFFKLLTSWLN